MKGSMVRLSKESISRLKMLKEVMNFSSYEEVVREMAHNVLVSSHAYTEEGYLPIGSVVDCGDGVPVVIESIVGSHVILCNKSFVVNGGSVCRGIKLLARNVAMFNGGTVDV